MAKAAVATPSVDVEAIDRLEQKLKQLVAVLERTRAEGARAADELARTRTEGARAADELARLRAESARSAEELVRVRAEHARAADENTRLRAEIDGARARLTDAEGAGTELTALRHEREQIRGRVNDMLKQIEALNL
jgi:chromosome segregation ATPase